MNPRTFVIGDTHFGHSNILTFKREDGSPLRPFATIEEHDEHIVNQWNKTVRPVDRVYHLGDCVINRRCLPILARLNGHKILRRGNHDTFRTQEYLEYFEEIIGDHVLGRYKAVLSHIPIHPESLNRWKYNIHGHLHSNKVLISPHHPDMRYKNVSCEQVNYTPVDIEELLG